MFRNHHWTAPFILALCLALVAIAAATAQEEEAAADPYVYGIDGVHTSAGFSVRHFTVSNVRGKFGKVEGTVRYNPDDLADSGVMVKIDATSIDTDMEQRDQHLKSADFFDVENHPEITFTSTKVEKSDEGMIVTGELTMRGVTKEVSMPFTMAGPIKDPLGMMRMGIEGGMTIDRRDWGLEWNKAMETGGLFVGHEVKIEIDAEAARK